MLVFIDNLNYFFTQEDPHTLNRTLTINRHKWIKHKHSTAVRLTVITVTSLLILTWATLDILPLLRTPLLYPTVRILHRCHKIMLPSTLSGHPMKHHLIRWIIIGPRPHRALPSNHRTDHRLHYQITIELYFLVSVFLSECQISELSSYLFCQTCYRSNWSSAVSVILLFRWLPHFCFGSWATEEIWPY